MCLSRLHNGQQIRIQGRLQRAEQDTQEEAIWDQRLKFRASPVLVRSSEEEMLSSVSNTERKLLSVAGTP